MLRNSTQHKIRICKSSGKCVKLSEEEYDEFIKFEVLSATKI
jgi:hypothetical protein